MKLFKILLIVLVLFGCSKTETIEPVYELEGNYIEFDSSGDWELSGITITQDSIFRFFYRDSIPTKEASGSYELMGDKIDVVLYSFGSGRIGAPCPSNNNISTVFENMRFIQRLEFDKSTGKINATTYIKADPIENGDCNASYISKKWYSSYY